MARLDDSPERALWSVAVLVVGAGVYALIEGQGGVTFFMTPLFVGVTAVAAGLVGTIRHLVAGGLSLVGWGIVVLLVHYGTIPSVRTAPAYMVGIAAGVLAARVVAPAARRSQWMSAAGISAILGGVGYYVEFDVSALGRWPAWCVTLVAWAVYEGLVTVCGPRATANLPEPSQV